MKKILFYTDQRHRLAVEILLIFLVPILLLKWGIVPISLRIPMLVFVSICVVGIVLRERWSWSDLGFRPMTRRAVALYGLGTIVGVCVIYLSAQSVGLQFSPSRDFFVFLLATFIPISFFQEFLYRGFLMHMLDRVYDDATTILLYNASLFTILHIMYPFPSVTLPLTFVGGLYFAWLYLQEKNLFLVTLSHAVLNFVALSLGFFVL